MPGPTGPTSLRLFLRLFPRLSCFATEKNNVQRMSNKRPGSRTRAGIRAIRPGVGIRVGGATATAASESAAPDAFALRL